MSTSIILDTFEKVIMNATEIEQMLFTFRGSLLAKSILIFGLTWQCLGLFIVGMSLFGVSISGRGATHGLFWASITTAYLLNVIFRIGVLIDPDAFSPFVVNLLFVLALALMQFSYAIVVLLLQRLCRIYDVGSHKTSVKDKLWLLFCACQIPINITFAIVRHEIETHTFFWSPINIFLTQLLTIGVFVYYRWLIQKHARETAVSVRTHDLLEYTIERFTEFSLVYISYCLTTFWGFMASWVSIASTVDTSPNWVYIVVLYLAGEPVANFYVTLCVMPILRPKWYMWIRRISVGGTFREPAVMSSTGRGNETFPSAMGASRSRMDSSVSKVSSLSAAQSVKRGDTNGDAGNIKMSAPRTSNLTGVTEEGDSLSITSRRASLTVPGTTQSTLAADPPGSDGAVDTDAVTASKTPLTKSSSDSVRQRMSSSTSRTGSMQWNEYSSSSHDRGPFDQHVVMPLSALSSASTVFAHQSADRLHAEAPARRGSSSWTAKKKESV